MGDLDDPHREVDVENPVCGDQLRLVARIEEGRLTAIAFRVRGCSGAIAAASAMTELVQGASLEEAKRVDRDAIDAALGGLPTLKRHGADLAADGLEALLKSG